jgi:hypothetical protein
MPDYRAHLGNAPAPLGGPAGSAWLIRRCIDPQAKLLWLATPADCPSDALGFDFDGATFTHVGARVSFEVLLASFGLETPPCNASAPGALPGRGRRAAAGGGGYRSVLAGCATPSSTTTSCWH